MIRLSKEKGIRSEKLIEYFNRLIEADSLLDSEKSFTTRRFKIDINISQMKQERQFLIDELKGNANRKNTVIWIVSSILSIVLVAFGLVFRRSLVYEKRFETLVKENRGEIKNREALPNSSEEQKRFLDDHLRFELLQKLNSFEREQLYLKRNLTLSNLAKKLQTNSSYLSQLINKEKNQNFSQYVKGLRIDYAINRLKTDRKWRKYTVESIAIETGFKSSSSFYKAFKKKTGITPSYFIEKISERTL
ncbi:MAG: helix-turn-helix transcriptional regulator [Leeuwenhoekiella sp.]